MKSTRKPRTVPKVYIDGPAVITPMHELGRPCTDNDGKPITGTAAWRNLSPLEAAHAKGQLDGGSHKYSAADRLEAGQNYCKLFMIANGAGGRDSTQAMNISGSRSGFEPPQSMQDGIRSLAKVELAMGARDMRIVRRVCGEGHRPADAIREICADYQDTVTARFREALDGLLEAFDRTKKGLR